jgi:hypothetical protein
MGLSPHYEENLVALIKQLRVQYSAPEAKFVTASLGQTAMNDTTSGDGLILEAMEAVSNGTKVRRQRSRERFPLTALHCAYTTV